MRIWSQLTNNWATKETFDQNVTTHVLQRVKVSLIPVEGGYHYYHLMINVRTSSGSVLATPSTSDEFSRCRRLNMLSFDINRCDPAGHRGTEAETS